jgi:ribose transport system permease protein
VTAVASRRVAVRRRITVRHGWTIGICLLLAALLVVEANSAPRYSSFDFQSLVIAALPLAFAAMGQAAIVISGGIDLSIGAQMAFTNCIAAKLMQGHGMGDAILICLLVMAIGVSIGALTGAAVVLSGVPDIVVTLASSFIWAGAALVVLKTPGGGSPTGFQNLTTLANVWEWLPNGLIVLIVAYALIWAPLRRTPLGLALYAVGSDREAAYLSGVRVGATRAFAYVLGGLFAALGGLALTSTTGIGSPLSGDLYTLNSVAAIVLGGVALSGGKGGLLGPVLAAFVVSIVVAILVFWGVDSNYGQVIQGGLMVLVVMAGGLLLLRRRA